MTITDLHASGHILLSCLAGSQAYGLATPQSDIDIRGVFYLPRARFYGLEPAQQLAEEGNDVVYYELGRFVELLGKNNPTILELLFTPDDCIRVRHPLLDKLRPGLVLSRLCEQSFAGYAQAQVKKARGLNKKVLNPMDEKRKQVLDFCHVVEGQGTRPLLDWLGLRGWRQEDCGLVNLPHMRDVYALFHAGEQAQALGFKGIVQGEASNNVSLSSIPKGMQPVGIMSFNKDGYSVYCKDYREYWEWVEKRNDARYQNTLSHGKNYDSKNMMHTFRLLAMAEEIAREGQVHVRRPDRAFLMGIRQGAYSYEELLDMAEARMEGMPALYAQSGLPAEPDMVALEAVLVEIREALYRPGL